jgi:DNA-binding transcriptional regulator YdaS (Cro superfamily)
MTLEEYIKMHKRVGYNAILARELGLHPVHLCAIKKGRRRPSVDLAFKIERHTNGDVTLRELLTTKRKRKKTIKG